MNAQGRPDCVPFRQVDTQPVAELHECHSGSYTGSANDYSRCVVVGLELGSNKLIGQLNDSAAHHAYGDPASLCDLDSLVELDLSFNYFSGPLLGGMPDRTRTPTPQTPTTCC